MPDQLSDEKGVPFDWQAAMRSMKTSDPNDPDADGYQEFYMWREILIENVRRGITTPDEAEKIVEARKASPLRRIPAIRLIPPGLMSEFRILAEEIRARPSSRAGLLAIILIWALAAGLAGWWAWKAFESV